MRNTPLPIVVMRSVVERYSSSLCPAGASWRAASVRLARGIHRRLCRRDHGHRRDVRHGRRGLGRVGAALSSSAAQASRRRCAGSCGSGRCHRRSCSRSTDDCANDDALGRARLAQSAFQRSMVGVREVHATDQAMARARRGQRWRSTARRSRIRRRPRAGCPSGRSGRRRARRSGRRGRRRRRRGRGSRRRSP